MKTKEELREKIEELERKCYELEGYMGLLYKDDILEELGLLEDIEK